MLYIFKSMRGKLKDDLDKYSKISQDMPNNWKWFKQKLKSLKKIAKKIKFHVERSKSGYFFGPQSSKELCEAADAVSNAVDEALSKDNITPDYQHEFIKNLKKHSDTIICLLSQGTSLKIADKIREFIRKNFKFKEKILFCPGTAPMQYSEIPDILSCTDFDVAYFVDPGYSDSRRFYQDIAYASELDLTFQKTHKPLSLNEKLEVSFNYLGKKRKIIFIAADATKVMPDYFNIFFSGRRVCINHENDDYGIKNTPKDVLREIIAKLPKGGLFFPDRDCEDDSEYFKEHPAGIGLQEIPGIREETRTIEVDFFKKESLLEKYRNEAINKGIMRKPEDVPRKKFFTNNGKDRYKSIEDFFSLHPELNREDFIINNSRVSYKDGGDTLVQYDFPNYTEQEQKIADDIETRAETESKHEVLRRGVSLYKKI